jgi:alkanesulfonate monooxygenase SsuD/methylene tetrahydromethanopterin reductase-like flavin-dependent oxidoreductase (luciferase family)
VALRWGTSSSLSGDLAEPAAVADLAVRAEASGWDGFFVWDHLWNRTGQPFADPWVTLAAVAAATDHIAVGTLVTPLPRRRPQVVAQQAATLDRLADGRLILGLGLGHDGYGEYSTFGEPLETLRARAEALDAGIDFLVQALTGAAVESVGRQTTIPARRQPRCPIWVAGRPGVGAGPRRARRHGLEGVAAVGEPVWSPDHVTDVLERGDFAPGEIDVALVGGRHPDPDRLAAAGATWAIPELMPGTTKPEAHQRIQSGPP